MKKVELVCARCGKKFIEESDYAYPGIQGDVTTSDGITLKFIDPTEPHHCIDCANDILVEMYGKLLNNV